MESLSCRCRVRGPQTRANADKSNKQKLAFQRGVAQPGERARERERARVPPARSAFKPTLKGVSSGSGTTNKCLSPTVLAELKIAPPEDTPTRVHEAAEDKAQVAGFVGVFWPFFTGTIKVLD